MKPHDDLKGQISEKSTQDLLSMFNQREDWTPDALNFAKEELQKRGLDEPSPIPRPATSQIRGAFSFNGFGTTFYGKREFDKDGSYLTTEWIIFAFIPILPIRSLRVRPLSTGGFSTTYSVFKRGSVNLKQVLFTYAYISIFFAWLLSVFALTAHFFPRVPDSTLGISMFLLVCLAPAPIPFFLRFCASKKAKV